MPKVDLIDTIVAEAVKEILPKSQKMEKSEISSKANSIKNESYQVHSRKFSIATESLSEKTKLAHQELLDGYVKSLNEVSAKLDTADREASNSNSSDFRNLKIDETYNINAAFLHGLYFENIGQPGSQVSTDSLSFMKIQRDWGTFDDWQKDFIACCLASRNGWVVTCYNTFLQRYMNIVVDAHSINVPFSCIPVIVMDCWEHAYYRDYTKDRKSYVFNMMKELRWERIEERFEKTELIARILK